MVKLRFFLPIFLIGWVIGRFRVAERGNGWTAGDGVLIATREHPTGAGLPPLRGNVAVATIAAALPVVPIASLTVDKHVRDGVKPNCAGKKGSGYVMGTALASTPLIVFRFASTMLEGISLTNTFFAPVASSNSKLYLSLAL